MPRTRIKICGIRSVEVARAAALSGADAIGLVFVKSSPRYVTPAQGAEIMTSLPLFVESVGLFQNPTLDEFMRIEEACPTTYTQLHGTEPEKLVRQCGPLLIKAVMYEADTIERELARWSAIEEVDAILVDGSPGGEGAAVDWHGLAKAADGLRKTLILAGGLTPENVGEAIRIVRPYAVDVSSGVERERGVKDPELIGSFCDAVRRADASLDQSRL
jgi:phosphoribosylanthranilate isomerase